MIASRTQSAPNAAPGILASKPRQDWVDNLRTAMILLVVNMHACVTYSYVGSWYYNAPPEPPLAMKLPFAFWQGHLQAFFMGLLFFFGGYYADRSLAKRGARSFVLERLRRLGIPTLLYMLVLHPLIVLGMHPGYKASSNPASSYLHFITSGRFLGGSGPMWFAFALLIFSVLFVLASKLLPTPTPGDVKLRASGVLAIGIGLAAITFLVRTVQPMGTSLLNFQLCYFPQYIAAFALGIWISRKDALASLANSPVARKAGITALVLGPLALLAVAIKSLPLPEHAPPPFNGGWNLSALGVATWEQMTGVGLALGAIAYFAARWNRRSPLSTWLSDRSFGVYLLHPPILVLTALAMQPIRGNAYVMAITLTILGLIASFAAADLARRVPGLKNVL